MVSATLFIIRKKLGVVLTDVRRSGTTAILTSLRMVSLRLGLWKLVDICDALRPEQDFQMYFAFARSKWLLI